MKSSQDMKGDGSSNKNQQIRKQSVDVVANPYNLNQVNASQQNLQNVN